MSTREMPQATKAFLKPRSSTKITIHIPGPHKNPSFLSITAWFNNLQYLKIDAAQFSSNRSIIEGLKSMKSLRKANFLRHPLSKYDAWKLGLEEVEFKCSREWDLEHRVEISIADARERRILAREQQLAEEAQRMERARRILEFQDALDIMSTAFAVLSIMNESGTYPYDGTAGELPNTSTNKSRCSTVDSGCEIRMESESTDEKQQRITENKVQHEQEANVDLVSIMKCVCVFKGKRYHFKED
ncbi:hypothetical protein BGX26_010747 [Mortierella sp. AD094]|nr:hypothetical protein BGX26_010747 [Mortierella sp. AD094]